MWRYFGADSKGWRIASFLAAVSLSTVMPFSVSLSVSVNVLLEVNALAIEPFRTIDHLAMEFRMPLLASLGMTACARNNGCATTRSMPRR